MNRRSPDPRMIAVVLIVGLILVALAVGLLGGAGGVRLIRLLVIYGGVFLVLLWVLRRARR